MFLSSSVGWVWQCSGLGFHASRLGARGMFLPFTVLTLGAAFGSCGVVHVLAALGMWWRASALGMRNVVASSHVAIAIRRILPVSGWIGRPNVVPRRCEWDRTAYPGLSPLWALSEECKALSSHFLVSSSMLRYVDSDAFVFARRALWPRTRTHLCFWASNNVVNGVMTDSSVHAGLMECAVTEIFWLESGRGSPVSVTDGGSFQGATWDPTLVHVHVMSAEARVLVNGTRGSSALVFLV